MPPTFENWNSEDKPKDKNHTNLIHKASQAIKDRIIPPENPNIPRSEVRFHRASDRVVKSAKPDILSGVKQIVGRGKDTWEQITAKDNEDIYPNMVEWWMNHSEHILQYWPDEPDESHPYYPDWQIARSFVHEGKVSKSMVEKTFKDDPLFYAKTMQIRRLHALRLHAVMGQLTRIKDSGPITADVLRQQAQSHGVDLTNLDINGIKMWGALTTLLATANLVVTMASGAVNFPHEALTTVANLGVVAAVGSAGVWASAKIAASAYEGMRKAVTEPNEFDRVTSACQQILDTVKGDNSLRHFMQATYGIDPGDLAIDPVTGGGVRKFLTTHGIGSTAQETVTFKDKIVSATGGWVATQEYLESEEKFRLLYLEKCVKVDTRRTHSLMSRFRGGHWEGQKPNIHLYEDEFLYHEGGSMIPGQSDALYEAKWNARFEQLAIARGIRLTPDNAPTLRLLFFEAGQELARDYGDERFKLIRNEIHYRDASPDVEYTPEEMKKKSDAWRAVGEKGHEGYERAKYKKGLTTQQTETKLLRTGKEAEDGKPPIAGLEQAKAVIDSTDASTPGLFNRKYQIESAYQEIITKAYEHLGSELEIRAKADELQRSQDLPGLDELYAQVSDTYLSIAKNSKGGSLYDAKASLAGIEGKHNDRVIEAETECSKITGSSGDEKTKKAAISARDKEIANSQAIRDRDKKYYEDRISELTGKADKLHELMLLILKKKNELIVMYDAMGAQNMNEAERVRTVHTAMVNNHEKIVTIIDNDKLLGYGTTGHELNDFMTTITTDPAKPWTPDEGRTHEKRMAVLYAVAEARARREVPAIKDVPTLGSLHEKILDGSKGGLTREQLVIMSPEEVYRRVSVKLSLNPVDKEADIQSIRGAIAHETTAYQTRLRALQQVIDTQKQIEARLAKVLIEADEVCTARQERIEIIREMVMEDRGAIYNLGPELTRRDALTSYSDGTKVSGSDLAYEDAERTHSKGFVKFMQDVFGYHHFDFAYRRAGSADKGTVLSRMRMDTLRDETKSREGLFLALLDSLGTSPEHDLAKMISSSFPAFESLLEPGVTADNLTFDQVMAVIAYRHDRTLPRPQFPNGSAFIAKERTYDLPVRPTDMRIVLRGVVGVLSEKALAGNI